MTKELVINTTSHETRVALLEAGHIAELYIERSRERGIVGNIYQGKVIRVLPGMQAAFVDIGLEKAAFLYVADVLDEMEAVEQFVEGASQHAKPSEGGDEEQLPPIEDLLQEGQEILVQVAKEPIGTKGARITSHISLPGRHLVYMPTVDHVGISRRIENEEEKTRLRELVEAIRPPGTGFIVRTAAEGKSEEDLRADMEFLVGLWREVARRRENRGAPALIHSDLDVTSKVLRDILTEDVARIVVDSREEYDKIVRFFGTFMPKLKYAIELHEVDEPIFDAFGLEVEIARALGRKVWLKSGGYIIIEQTEALTAIDVNTGRFVGKHNLEDTILKTNLEAVKEIAYQLRLRNIGGLIIIDFIDMEKEAHREKVHSALEEALKSDKEQDQHPQDLRARPGRDDPEAGAREHRPHPLRALPLLRGEGVRQKPHHHGLRDLPRAAPRAARPARLPGDAADPPRRRRAPLRRGAPRHRGAGAAVRKADRHQRPPQLPHRAVRDHGGVRVLADRDNQPPVQQKRRPNRPPLLFWIFAGQLTHRL